MVIIEALGWLTLIALVGLAVGHATGRVKFGVEVEPEEKE